MKSGLLSNTSLHKKKAVIFVSANNDIAYSVAKATQYDYTLFVVTENDNVYKFMHMLGIENSNILYLESKLKQKKRLSNWLDEYKYIKRLKQNIFSSISGYDVIFRAHAYDLLTCALVHYLAEINSVEYAGSQESLNMFDEHWSLSGIPFQMVYSSPLIQYEHIGRRIMGLEKKYVLSAKTIPLPKTLMADTIGKYSIHLRKDINYILILDDGDSQTKDILNFNEVMVGIVNKLKQMNIEFMIKPHPRFGVSNCFKPYGDNHINLPIPVEFINPQNIICIIGHYSIGLANYANMGASVVSLINIFEYGSSARDIKSLRKQYLSDNDTNSKIEYLNNLSDLFEIIQKLHCHRTQ